MMRVGRPFPIADNFTLRFIASKKTTGFNSNCTKRCFSARSEGDLPDTMSRWETSSYGSIECLEFNNKAVVPKWLEKDQVLIKVKAASVNPFDIEMIEGYGSKAMNILRNLYNVREFPLVPGRDCSGVVVRTGRRVRRFKVGDEVWCARWVLGDGTLADYCTAHQSEVSLKPKTLNHLEAACFPYVASTTWVSLISRGGLNPKSTCNRKHVLVLGGSGGIGTFAIQLAKYLGTTVTTTCSDINFDLVRSLGADNAIDYRDTDLEQEVKNNGPYDIILDARKGDQTKMIGSTEKTIYISLMPPFLPSIDQSGLMLGLMNSGMEFYGKSFENFLQNRGKYSWGLFFPNSGILKSVADIVDNGMICPVIGKVFKFDDVREALKMLETGSTKGKVIIDMAS